MAASSMHTKYGKKRMMEWFRLEQRFRRNKLNDSNLASSTNFNYRLRYNIWYDVPFCYPNCLCCKGLHEVHLQKLFKKV